MESAAYGPWQVVLEFVHVQLASDNVWFKGRRLEDTSIRNLGDVIGWADDEFVYVTQASLWSAFERDCRSRGVPVPFSWTQWKREALQRGAEYVRAVRLFGASSPRAAVRVPRDSLGLLSNDASNERFEM